MFSRGLKEGIALVTGKQCVPAATTLTGTVTSVGTLVTGTNTLFTTEILDQEVLYHPLKYKFLYDSNQTAVREIAYVLSDTSLILKEAFAGDMSSQTLKCPDPMIEYSDVSVLAIAAGAVLDGVVLASGSVVNYHTERDGAFKPCAINGTTGNIQLEVVQ